MNSEHFKNSYFLFSHQGRRKETGAKTFLLKYFLMSIYHTFFLQYSLNIQYIKTYFKILGLSEKNAKQNRFSKICPIWLR